MIYTFIAYKPDSDDFCRGCHMASYSSDFCLEIGLDREGLINMWANFLFKNKVLQCNEDGYDFVVLSSNEKLYDMGCHIDDTGDIESIESLAKEKAEEIMKEFQKIENSKKQKETERKLLEHQKSKRALYEDLKKEFGD
jgi:hypothetical protein